MKKINIQISLEESLDRLAIITIKYNITNDPKLKEKLSAQLLDLEMRIAKAIGYKKYQELMKSKEYSELFEANQSVFDGVDRSETRDEKFLAYDLNELNKKRTAAKRNISLKYCNEESQEVKIRGKT